MKKKDISKTLSVVVLEDNEGDFVLVEDHLIETFKTVQVKWFESFIDFREFLNKKAEPEIDLILLDLYLPDISGLELIQKLISEKIQVPIIILTGYADIELAKQSLKLGVDDFLIKDEITPTFLHKSIEFAFSRGQYVMLIEEQNKKLRNIAWTQAHEVRAPLSRMLGIIDLIDSEKESIEENVNAEDLMFLLDQLKTSSTEIDEIVRNMIDEAKEV